MPLRTILITATRSGTASTVIIRRGASGTGTGGGTSDHGALTGREDDDHPQYHNDARGDARYASTAALSGKASLADANNFTATQSFAQPVYLSGAVLGVIPTPIAGAYNGPGTGLTGTAANLSVGTASTAAYATTAGTANALAGILPITSGGTGGATQSAAWTALGGGGTIASPTFTGVATGSMTFSAEIKSTTPIATPSAFSANQASVYAHSSRGAVIHGFGSVNDVTIVNRSGAVVVGIPANSQVVQFAGQVSAGPITSSGAIIGANLSTAGAVESTTSTAGLILKSPNNKRWRVTIENDGTLTRTELT